ncbi:hypothetical protein PIROE2DRAFT_47720 [Piromyces sp. E2]|nr:hypothetical protein PIROE2DRAFT_47720 [Piromyces sp. E2]|eukprot:OUM58712.1 hypothetical protein PIROE2DRAFT_47720 [Piromyces sp. E2]
MADDYAETEYFDFDFHASNGIFEFRKIKYIYEDLYKYLIILGIVGIVSFIGSFIYFSYLGISASRQTTKIRSLVYRSLMKQEISWHERTSPGELTSRIISDTLLIEEGIGVKVGTLIQYICTFIGCFVVSFIKGWKLTLYMAVILPALVIIVCVMGFFLKKYTKKVQDVHGEVGGIAQEAFSQIRTVVTFGNEQKEIDRYLEKLKPTLKYGIIKNNIFGFCFGLIFAVIFFSYTIAFIKGTQLIHRGEMVSGDVLKVFLGVMMGAMSLSGCGDVLNAFGEATGAATKLFHIIERKPEIDADAEGITKSDLTGEIEFRNVHFSYPARPDVEILKGISFHCKPGKTIALVGASGSGKSTIVQLLERYYDKSGGQIFVDGKKIESYNVHWLRSQIGFVSQEPTLFDATIAENIAITCPEASQKEIEAAAKLANAHDFITQLPNGYQTSTGERGLQLSGGQKQRICIARALMMNPKILLLDEATSALDNQSEKVVQAALDSASFGRTTIIIAHRLSTIKNADTIIVMEKGKIIESGTHDSLMSKQNVYYNLVKSQEMNIHKYTKSKNKKDQKRSRDNNSSTSSDEFSSGNSTTDEDEENSDIFANESSKNNKSELKPLLPKKNTSKSQEKNKKETGGSALSKMNWKRYLAYNKPVWWANLIGIFGSTFNGSIQPAFAYIFASAINAFNKQGDWLLEQGRFWGYMFILLGFGNFLFYYFQVGGFSTAGEYLSYTFRKEMFKSMIKQEIGFYDTNEIGHHQKDEEEEAKENTNSLNVNLGSILEIIVNLIVGFGITFVNGWKLTLILLAAAPFLFAGIYLLVRAGKNRNKAKRHALENSTKIAVESILNIKTVYALNLENHFGHLYEANLKEPQKSLEYKFIISSIGSGFSNAVSFFAYILGFYVGFRFIESGEIEFNNMLRAVMSIIFTAMAVGRATSAAPDYNKAAEAFGHVLEIIDRPSQIDASDPKGLTGKKMKGEISFKNIKFSYPSRPKVTVLRLGDDEIEIPEGKKLAIVGGSGCGKSTIIGLLPRWYDAQQGEVTVDRKKNVDYQLKWLRENIGMVNQEPSLFNISIKENIRYGKVNATDKEVIEAAKKANIHDFVRALPDGYDTVVGSIGTSRMSGGQKQRIAIARAIIRNPKILLLDEATSALDAESESIVQKALDKASQGRTTITIAHRLSTIRNADVIVVMKKGRIIEKGNHEELMSKKGEYYEMVLAGDGGIPQIKS